MKANRKRYRVVLTGAQVDATLRAIHLSASKEAYAEFPDRKFKRALDVVYVSLARQVHQINDRRKRKL